MQKLVRVFKIVTITIMKIPTIRKYWSVKLQYVIALLLKCGSLQASFYVRQYFVKPTVSAMKGVAFGLVGTSVGQSQPGCSAVGSYSPVCRARLQVPLRSLYLEVYSRAETQRRPPGSCSQE